jgi:uncharacterized membrane protein YphA (DoxX/SURF4 family)/3-mercaptopyruvate sulfurtransferase SseA
MNFMKIPDILLRKSSLPQCLGGAVAIVFIAMVGGLAANHFSRRPLTVMQKTVAGLQKIDVKKALMVFEQKIQFVDARAPDVFKDGHIPGAYNLDYYDSEKHFSDFSKKFDKTTPLVVYCQGISGPHSEDTCETSRLLAELLTMRGYNRVMLFEQGYAFWEAAKNPIDHGNDSGAAAENKKIPFVSYFRDLIMLVIGIAVFAFFRKNKPAVALIQILLGIVFIVSGSTKLFHPDKLAVILDAYRIMPAVVIPFAAVCMPWIEFVSGICLAFGLLPSSGALIVLGMHVFFIPALSYRALFLARQLGISIFNVDFDCGCGLGENFAWVLILRDFGFLFMGLTVLLSTVRPVAENRSGHQGRRQQPGR